MLSIKGALPFANSNQQSILVEYFHNHFQKSLHLAKGTTKGAMVVLQPCLQKKYSVAAKRVSLTEEIVISGRGQGTFPQYCLLCLRLQRCFKKVRKNSFSSHGPHKVHQQTLSNGIRIETFDYSKKKSNRNGNMPVDAYSAPKTVLTNVRLLHIFVV